MIKILQPEQRVMKSWLFRDFSFDLSVVIVDCVRAEDFHVVWNERVQFIPLDDQKNAN